MAYVDSSSHTWLAEQKGGNAQELAVMSVLSFREINGKTTIRYEDNIQQNLGW